MGAKAAQQESGRPWDGLVRREIPIELRVLDAEDRSVEVVASTESLDAHGDVVKQHWDLGRYNKNGPVLWNHNIHESSPYSFGGSVRPEDTMPVGKASDVRVEGGKLLAKLTLVKGTPEQEPLVDKLWRRVQQGVIKAVSVGFRPGSITKITNPDGSTKHYELGSGDRPNELREISFVPMGSNPEAVAKSIAFEREQFRLRTSEEPARVAGSEAANAEGETHMSMTAEEKKMLEDTQVEARVAKEKAATLETELKTEKSANARLETELKSASERAAKAEAALVDGGIDKLVGKKLYPAEREEWIGLAKEIGLPRVEKMLAARPDITITTPVTVDGKPVAETSKSAPEPVEGKGEGNASADIAKAASEAATKAA